MIRIFDDSQNSRNIQGLGIFKISQRIQRFQWLRIPSNPFANTLLLWNRNRPVCASHSSTALQLAETALGSTIGLVRSIDRPQCARPTPYLFQDYCRPRLLTDICLTKWKIISPVTTAAAASANGSTTAAPVLGNATPKAFQSSLLDSTA